jgi:hypothetical protein
LRARRVAAFVSNLETMRERERRRWTRTGRAAALSLLAGCLAPEPLAVSEWPPADFELVIRSYQVSGGILQERRRMVARADGLVVYREATSGIGGPAQQTPWFPVFDVVSAYRLRPESLRQLTRLLDDAELFDFTGTEAVEPGFDELLLIDWHALGRAGRFALVGADIARASRILHVVNAFLPDGYAFAPVALVGEAEPPHLTGVPAPAYSRPEAIHFHWQRAQEEPDRLHWILDLFALARAAGDRELAEEMVERVRAHPQATIEDDPAFGRGSRIALDELLQRLLG